MSAFARTVARPSESMGQAVPWIAAAAGFPLAAAIRAIAPAAFVATSASPPFTSCTRKEKSDAIDLFAASKLREERTASLRTAARSERDGSVQTHGRVRVGKERDERIVDRGRARCEGAERVDRREPQRRVFRRDEASELRCRAGCARASEEHGDLCPLIRRCPSIAQRRSERLDGAPVGPRWIEQRGRCPQRGLADLWA